MSADPAERAVQGQAAQVLNKAQVRDLILAAQTAWRVQQRCGLADEPFDVWRHAALHDACGRQSFRAVTQGEYGRALAYMLNLAGKKAATRKAAAKAPAADEASRARWALERECQKLAAAFGGLTGATAYADALLERIHKTDRYLATAKQLWQVLFTVRNRAKAKRSKTAQDASGASGQADGGKSG